MRRKTRETFVELRLNPWGRGKIDIALPDRWTCHMVETLATYASFDLKIAARGDLLHHLIEDAAITLGHALRAEIGCKNIVRMGSSTVVMDDAMVTAAVDLVERPFADIKLPDKMIEHFLRSFAHEGKFTLHNLVHKGDNHHHIVEATMKATGLALKEALRAAERFLSTKGKVREL